MDKKYELLADQTIEVEGRTLYRIRALRSFGDVQAGDIGGYVQSEENLSHDGNCWVYDDAMVFGYACVCNDAHVYGDAKVFGHAWVYGSAKVCGKARFSGDVQIRDYRSAA